jgi:protein O-mannosyl-transferase
MEKSFKKYQNNDIFNYNMHRNTYILGILIIAVGAIILTVYWPVLSCQAQSFDDNQYFVDNPLVHSPSWASAKRFLCEVLRPSTVKGYYQPLTMISLMLDYAVTHQTDDLSQYHRTNLIIHITNTILIIVLLYILFGNPYIAAIVGLLFGLHPLTVEAVAWTTERKTLLAAFFGLWCMVFYILFAHRHKYGFYITCLLMYILSLMSKPTGILLPICLLFLDYWPLNRFSKKTIFEKILFFAITIISSIISFISQKSTCGITMPKEYGFFRIPLVFCYNVTFYLGKIFWPINSSPYYPFPEPLNLSNHVISTSVVGCAVFIFLLIISIKWTRALLFGGIFFVIMLLPTMQVFQFSETIVSDKFIYLPSVGILIATAFLLSKLWLTTESTKKLFYLKLIFATLIGFLCITESFKTRLFLVNWRDTIDHWKYMVNNEPNKVQLRYNYALFLQKKGHIDEAISNYTQVLERNRKDTYQYNSFMNMALCFANTGRYSDVENCYTDALKIYPDSSEFLNNLAWQMATCPEKEYRDGSKAVLYAKKACELTGFKNFVNLDTLAAAYAEASQFDEAVKTAEKAIEIALLEEKQALAEDMKNRLNLYKAKLPYREKPLVM